MSDYLVAIMAHSQASVQVHRAQRAVQVAQLACAKAERQAVRHQCSRRQVRQRYARHAVGQFDALDEARAALDAAQQQQQAAAALEQEWATWCRVNPPSI